MLFDTPLLNFSAAAPVASSSSGAAQPAPGSVKKRRRSSSNAGADGPGAAPAGAPVKLPGTEINLDKLLKRMKAQEGGAGGKAQGGAGNQQQPQQPKEGKGKKPKKAPAAVEALKEAPVKPVEAAPSPAPSNKRQKKDKKKGKSAAPASPAVHSAALPDSPEPAASAPALPQRHAAPSQVVTASTAGKSGSVQDKLRAQLAGGKFRMLNEQLYTTSGGEAHSLMQEDGAFDDYHIGFRSQAATWPVHPLALIAQSLLSSLPVNALIADFGCGDAALARTLVPNASPAATGLPPMPSLKVPAKLIAQKQLKVASFDLVSQSSYVVEAECSSVPLPGGTAGGEIVDAVVCCLSLMGTDWIGMVREAKRVLKDGGVLKIAEVTSRFTSIDEFVKLVNALGFSLSHKDVSNTHFILLDFTKKSGADANEEGKAAERTRKAATLLNPCIYKRR
ncbi:25S rRNA (adenine645-N1)-methyltransferase [Rhodotorula kratochvilovae]